MYIFVKVEIAAFVIARTYPINVEQNKSGNRSFKTDKASHKIDIHLGDNWMILIEPKKRYI